MTTPQPWVRDSKGSVYIPDGARERRSAVVAGVIAAIVFAVIIAFAPRMWLMMLPIILLGFVYGIPAARSPIQAGVTIKSDGLFFDDGRVIKWAEIKQAVVMDKEVRGQHLYLYGDDNGVLACLNQPFILLRLVQERHPNLPVRFCKLGPDPHWYMIIMRGTLILCLGVFVAALWPASRLLQGDPSPTLPGTMTQMLVGAIIGLQAILVASSIKSWGWLDQHRMPPVIPSDPPKLSVQIGVGIHCFDPDRELRFLIPGKTYLRQIERQKQWLRWFPLVFLALMSVGYVNNLRSGRDLIAWLIQGAVMYALVVGGMFGCLIFDRRRLRNLVAMAERGDYLALRKGLLRLVVNGETAESAKVTDAVTAATEGESIKVIAETWRSWDLDYESLISSSLPPSSTDRSAPNSSRVHEHEFD